MKQFCSLILISSVFAACHSGADAAAQGARQKTIDSLNMVVSNQRIVDSMKALKVQNEKVVTHVVERNSMTNASNQPGEAAAPEKKKGWSHTAKGAVVGAATGAATGAIINYKNRGEGAVIGTLIGAGVGAGTGAIVDNSVKKKKQRIAKEQAIRDKHNQ